MKQLQVDISTTQYLSWLLQPDKPKPTFYLLPVLSPTASNPSSHYEKHVLSRFANRFHKSVCAGCNSHSNGWINWNP